MELRELVDLIIQERISSYFSENSEGGKEEIKHYNAFLNCLKENAPDLEEEFQKYVDWLAAHDEDQEGLYLAGVKDGIRIMRAINNIK